MVENLGKGLDIELLASRAIGGGRGRRELDPLEGGIGLQLANHFLAAPVRIEHLAEERPESVLLGEKSSATHGPLFLWLENAGG